MEGWIKLHRRLLNWEWIDDHNTTRLFLFILLLANHTNKNWRGTEIKRGSFITSRYKLSSLVGISEQQTRTSLDKLKSTSEITSESTNEYTLITVLNYDSYQGEITSQVTNEQPASNQPDNKRVTTTKNEKKIKNEKKREKSKRFTPPTKEEILEYMKEKDYVDFSERFLNHYESNGWMVGKNKMKNWKASVSGWASRDDVNLRKNNDGEIKLKKDGITYF